MRFPEFSGEWEKCKLGDIATGFDYGMNAAAKPFDGENKYIRITDIDEASSTYIDKDIVSPDGTLTENYLVNDRDILLARTGASTGKSYLYRKSDGKLYYAGFLIRANVTKHNPYFVFSQLHTHRYWSWVSIMSARSGQPGINSQEYSSFPVYVTSLREEEKISALLSLIDERIATQNKIIEKLESLIKGIYDKVLWQSNKQTSLSEILVERNERTTINNQYQVLSSTAKGLYRQSDYFDKEVASANNIGYKVLRLGDIVLSPQNLWLGNINYNDLFEIGIVSPSYKVFSIRNSYNPYYVSCFLKTPKALYEYTNASEQGASVVRRNLDINAFMAICFPMPNKILQDKTSERLRKINMKLDIEKQIHERLYVQKQYLLRHMFI